MRKTRTTQIQGQTWTLVEHPATEGLTILRNITTLVGQAIGTFAGAGVATAETLMGLDIGIEGIARLADQLLAKLEDDKVVWLVRLICKYVQDKDGPIFADKVDRFDDVFAGSYGMLGQVVAWVLKENFGEVFQSTGIGALFAAPRPVIDSSHPPFGKPSGNVTEQ